MNNALVKEAKPRIAVIGLGRIAWMMDDDPLRNKPCTHVGAYLNRGCTIVAGCDTSKERRQLFSDRFGVRHVYNNYNDMLTQHTLDGLSICAYATDRKDMLMAGVRHHVPAIFCEKAFASSLEEADEMVDAIKKAGTHVVVGHMRRWVAEYQQVKTFLDDGVLGELQSVNVAFSGSLIHTGTHAFDVLNWWFGKPLAVRGKVFKDAPLDKESGYRHATMQGADAGGVGQIFFAHDMVVNVEARVKNYFIFELDLIGSDGRVRIGNDGILYYKREASRRVSGFHELSCEPIRLPVQQATPWDAAVMTLLTKPNPKDEKSKQSCYCNAADARTALEIAIAFFVSDARGGQEMRFPLTRTGVSIPSR